MTILDDRLAQLDTLTLEHGSHNKRDDGMCAMEAVAWLAGEGHTDHPECVSRVIADFMIGLNDAWDTETRQVLKGYLPRLVGTNTGPDDEQTRGLLAADWLIRTYTPAWLRLVGLTDNADAVAGLPPVTDWSVLADCMTVLEESRRKSAAAWDAAGAAARAAARDALAPTVEELRASALSLLDRMIEVGR